MARLAIVVMISNSDAHVVAAYVIHHGDLIINTYRDKRRSGNVAVQGASPKIKLLQRICAILGTALVNRQTWELQVFRDINKSLCGTNNARTDFFRNTAGESLDSESLLQGNIFSD